MSRVLRESDVLRVMREVHRDRITELARELDVLFKPNGKGTEEQNVLSPELKLRHKKSGLLYTISSVGPRDAILRTPEDKEFLVDKNGLEAEYELD